MNRRAVAFALALGFDLGVGELPARGHPVVLVGSVIGRLAGRSSGRARADLVRGTIVMVGTGAAAWGVGRIVGRYDRSPLGFLATIWLLKASFALRSLVDAADRVAVAVRRDDLDQARRELPWLVSRPVAGLDRAHICSATIESLAENLADSYVGPLIAYSLGGLPAALAYRAVNTADAMIGYRGEFEYLGKAAARIDDAMNLAPSRITTAALVISAPAVGLPLRRAARVALRDGSRTVSPNAGWPMAAAAGALGVWLEKPGVYRLGGGRPAEVTDVVQARRLILAAALLISGLYLAWEVSR